MSLLCGENLVKRFGSFAAVNGVSLAIEPGAIFGLIGPNGAGKSTLLKMITSLIAPTSGRVLIHGVDVAEDSEKALAGVGAVIEFPNFYLDLSARHNLNLLSGGSGKAYSAKLAKVIDFVGMTPFLDQKVRTFSTGMKQRLGIAFALLPDSELIILDEPTNGLDPAGIVEIRELIRDYNREYGVTVLVTSHMLGEIEQICTDIGILQRGKLAAMGKLGDLLSSRPAIRLEVAGDNAAIPALLAASTLPVLGCEPAPDGDGWLVDCEIDCRAEINRLLAERGLTLITLALQKRSLESYFLEVTAEEGKK